MGIQGLLPVFKSIIKPSDIARYKGERVGIDAYSWLHKGAICCSFELAQGIPTDKYIQYCMHRVNLFKHWGVIPVLVFDGGRMPMKEDTEASRRASRKKHREIAQELLRAGQKQAANDHFSKAIDITSNMIISFLQVLKHEKVEFVVAPYEADAQLAYLAKNGYISLVVTEDSDLIAYGVPKILFKMDKYGQGMEFQYSEVGNNSDLDFVNWTPKMLLTMCILSGCDYVSSLPGIGVRTAYKIVKQHRTSDKIFDALKSHKNLTVKEVNTYEQRFHKALTAFKYHRVYDPKTRELTTVEPLKGTTEDELQKLIGKKLSTAEARSVCEGFMDPTTLKRYPMEMTADAKAFCSRSTGSRVHSTFQKETSGWRGQTLSVADVPATAWELRQQPKIGTFMMRQTAASKAAFKPPTQTSSTTSGGHWHHPQQQQHQEAPQASKGGLRPLLPTKTVIRKSRFFSIPPCATGEVTTPKSAPNCREHNSPLSPVLPAAQTCPTNTSSQEISTATSPNSPVESPLVLIVGCRCPNGTEGCAGNHSLFAPCRVKAKSSSQQSSEDSTKSTTRKRASLTSSTHTTSTSVNQQKRQKLDQRMPFNSSSRRQTWSDAEDATKASVDTDNPVRPPSSASEYGDDILDEDTDCVVRQPSPIQAGERVDDDEFHDTPNQFFDEEDFEWDDIESNPSCPSRSNSAVSMANSRGHSQSDVVCKSTSCGGSTNQPNQPTLTATTTTHTHITIHDDRSNSSSHHDQCNRDDSQHRHTPQHCEHEHTHAKHHQTSYALQKRHSREDLCHDCDVSSDEHERPASSLSPSCNNNHVNTPASTPTITTNDLSAISSISDCLTPIVTATGDCDQSDDEILQHCHETPQAPKCGLPKYSTFEHLLANYTAVTSASSTRCTKQHSSRSSSQHSRHTNPPQQGTTPTTTTTPPSTSSNSSTQHAPCDIQPHDGHKSDNEGSQSDRGNDEEIQDMQPTQVFESACFRGTTTTGVPQHLASLQQKSKNSAFISNMISSIGLSNNHPQHNAQPTLTKKNSKNGQKNRKVLSLKSLLNKTPTKTVNCDRIMKGNNSQSQSTKLDFSIFAYKGK